MRYQPIECEVFTTIIAKKDCAYHKKLGWSKTDWHTHNRGQLIYAEFGIMRLYTEEQVFYIPSWHAAWIPEGIRHRVITESPDLVFRTLYLEHQGMSHPFYNTISIFHVSHLLKEMILYTERWPMKEKALPEEKAFLTAIKYLLPEQATTAIQLKIPVSENPVMQDLTDYLNMNLTDKLKAGDIARKFAMSERSMSRLFLKEFSMPFIQYLKLLRIIKAVELLTAPGKQVSEIAYEVGYESVPSFNSSFKEIMGNSPAALYRK